MKKNIAVVIILSLIALFSCSCVRKHTSAALVDSNQESAAIDSEIAKQCEELGQYFGELEKQELFSGYVLMVRNNKIVFSEGYGYADFENKIKHTEKTKFNMASLGKQIVATGIMQLYEKGQMRVDDKLNKFLPGFPSGDKINIHQLLTHSSGLPASSNGFDLSRFSPLSPDRDKALEGYKGELELLFEPGSGFGYSSVGYILLGYVIEAVTHQPFEEYLFKKVIEPLKMKDTVLVNETNRKGIKDIACAYMEGPYAKYEDRYLNGMYTTLYDLYLWSSSLYSGKLIKPETQELMHTPYVENYGYGWYIGKNSRGETNFVHGGNAYGYRSYMNQKKNGAYFLIYTNIQYTDFDSVLLGASDILNVKNKN